MVAYVREYGSRRLQEVLGGDKLLKQLMDNKNIHLYWGTATTGEDTVDQGYGI